MLHWVISPVHELRVDPIAAKYNNNYIGPGPNLSNIFSIIAQQANSPLPWMHSQKQGLVGLIQLKKSSLGSSHKKVRFGVFWFANWFGPVWTSGYFSIWQKLCDGFAISLRLWLYSCTLTDQKILPSLG